MGDTQLSKPSNIIVLAEFFQSSYSVCPVLEAHLQYEMETN